MAYLCIDIGGTSISMPWATVKRESVRGAFERQRLKMKQVIKFSVVLKHWNNSKIKFEACEQQGSRCEWKYCLRRLYDSGYTNTRLEQVESIFRNSLQLRTMSSACLEWSLEGSAQKCFFSSYWRWNEGVGGAVCRMDLWTGISRRNWLYMLIQRKDTFEFLRQRLFLKVTNKDTWKGRWKEDASFD